MSTDDATTTTTVHTYADAPPVAAAPHPEPRPDSELDTEPDTEAGTEPDPASGTDADAGSERAELARRQTELLAALVAGGPVPDGFDADRLRVQSWSLAAKRRDGVARTLPALATELGERWPRAFMDWARTHPKPAAGGSHADTLAFIDHLRVLGELPDEVEALISAETDRTRSARKAIRTPRKSGLTARLRARFTRRPADWDPEAAYCSD